MKDAFQIYDIGKELFSTPAYPGDPVIHRQSIKPFRKIRKEVLRYQTIVTRLCYGESGYSTLFFASRKDYTNTHTLIFAPRLRDNASDKKEVWVSG